MQTVNSDATMNTVTNADHLAVQLPLQVMGLSTVYAATLELIERRFPTVLPDHLWAEVAGGVVLSLAPVAWRLVALAALTGAAMKTWYGEVLWLRAFLSFSGS